MPVRLLRALVAACLGLALLGVTARADVTVPAVFSDGMVAPLVPYAIRGVVWYQGESNAPRARQCRPLFPTLIRDWRDRWACPDLPFYFVQLANFKARAPEPGESDRAELREAQFLTLRDVPATGMAVTIDVGEEKDIHPRNKQDVGARLAVWALARDYGRAGPVSGPLYADMKRAGNSIVLSFEHVEGGLRASDGEALRGFAIAGRDRVFVWAQARVEGDTVVVSCPTVKRPAAVRYAWAENPDCNLVNGAGLPASPFRTDDWPGLTDGKD